MLFVLLALQTLLLEAPLLVKLLPLLPLRLDAPPLLGLGPAKHGRQCSDGYGFYVRPCERWRERCCFNGVGAGPILPGSDAAV